MMEDRKDQTSKDNSSNALYSVVNPSFELQHTKGLERPTVEQNMEKKIIGANSKQKFRSLNCAVCGDNAHGLYLGVLSCTACEIFFKQSIRKKAVYCCIGAQKCSVTKYNRHRCQFCRLQKCFFVGMKSKTSLQRDIPKKINDSLMQKTSPQISMLKDPANPSVLLPIFPTKMDVPSIPKVSYYPMTNLHGKILQQEQKYLVVGRLLTMQTNSNTDLRALSNIVATHATTANTVEPPYSNSIVSVAKAANGSPSVSCSQEFKTIIGGSSEEQSRISCIRSEEQCQTTYITSKPPQTTFISSEQFQTTCIRSEQSQTTCISSEQSQTTCINSEQPEITCISSEQSQTTCIDNEEQTWNPCIGGEEKSLTPCKSKVQLQTVCQSTCHEEESLTSFKSIEEQSPTPCKSTEEQGQNLCISDEEESSIHFINIEEQSPATCLSDEKQFQASCISNEEQPLTFSLTNKEQLQITCKSSEEHSQTLCISNKEESWIPLTKPKKQCQTLCEDEEQYPKKRKREDLSSFSPSTYASNEEKTTKNYSDRNWRVKDLEAIKIFYEKKPVSFKTFVRTVKSVYSPGTYFTETVSKFCQLEKEHINFSLDFEDFPSPGSDACDIDAVKKKMLAELEQNREKIAATLSDPHKKLTVFKGILWNLAADLFLREIIELVTKMARRLISSIGRQKMAPKKAKKRRSERLRVLTKKLNIGRNEEHGMISTEASEISTKEQRTGVSGRWTKRTREQKTGANEARGKRTEEQRTGVNERRGKRTHEQKTGASERRGKRTHEGKTGATERRGKRTHEHKAGVNERKGNRTQEGKTGANEARGKRTEEYSVEIDKDDFCYIDLYKIFGEVYFLKFGEAIKRSVTILKNTTSCRPDLSYFLFNSQTYLFSIIQAETVQEEEGSNIALEDQVGSDVLGRVAVNLLAEAPFSVFKPYSLGIICVKTKMVRMKIYDKKGKSMVAQEYNGEYFPYPLAPGDIAEHLNAVKRMPTRDDDILISTYPKSGTHWLLEAIHMMKNKSLDYLRQDYPISDKTSDIILPFIDYTAIDKFERMPSPRLLVSHLKPEYLPSDFKGRIVNLSRDPKDVAVSYYVYLRNVKHRQYSGEWNDFIPMFLEGQIIWGSWFEHTTRWRDVLTDYPQYRIHFVTYEDLHQDFVQCLKKISSFLEIDVDDELLRDIHRKCKIENIKKSRLENPDPNSTNFMQNADQDDIMYRKGKMGEWKSWFTVSQIEMFDNVVKI